jgi:hypothetical protein
MAVRLQQGAEQRHLGERLADQALKAAHLTGAGIPGVDEALDRAMLDLKRVQSEDGSFGYREPPGKYSLTGVGVLCTYFWKQDKDRSVRDWHRVHAPNDGRKIPSEVQGTSSGPLCLVL